MTAFLVQRWVTEIRLSCLANRKLNCHFSPVFWQHAFGYVRLPPYTAFLSNFDQIRSEWSKHMANGCHRTFACVTEFVNSLKATQAVLVVGEFGLSLSFSSSLSIFWTCPCLRKHPRFISVVYPLQFFLTQKPLQAYTIISWVSRPPTWGIAV